MHECIFCGRPDFDMVCIGCIFCGIMDDDEADWEDWTGTDKCDSELDISGLTRTCSELVETGARLTIGARLKEAGEGCWETRGDKDWELKTDVETQMKKTVTEITEYLELGQWCLCVCGWYAYRWRRYNRYDGSG